MAWRKAVDARVCPGLDYFIILFEYGISSSDSEVERFRIRCEPSAD